MIRISQRDISETDRFIERLKSEYPDVELTIHYLPKRNNISLSHIVVPKAKRNQGIGTAILRKLTDYAKEKGIRIVLTPSTDFGATSKNRLKDFYKGFGFVENKNRNKDFSIYDSMYLPVQGAKL